MQLRYLVPFEAQQGVSAEFALKEKLINIEGLAIDTSVNANKWQVPEEDLDYFAETLKGAQLRADHAESVFMVVGKVPEAQRQGREVYFRAEVGEEKLVEKILRGYVTHVSVQVDSDDVECSKCKRPTRKEGLLIHLCPGAWEIVHKPKVRELSIVASPAYKNTEFKPVGFAAAMDCSQNDAKFEALKANAELLFRLGRLRELLSKEFSQLPLKSSEDGGSKRKLQEPDKKTKINAKEVKPLSELNAQQGASPQQAQGVVNTAPGEQAPKQVTYEEFINQLTQLEKQIQSVTGASDADLDALKKKVADLEGEVAKRATKKTLSKKISELSKYLQQPEEDDGDHEKAKSDSATEGSEAKRASGKGIVAVDEIQKDALANYDWFKDLLKAHKKLTGFQ